MKYRKPKICFNLILASIIFIACFSVKAKAEVEYSLLASYSSAQSGKSLPDGAVMFVLNPTYTSWRDECSECGNAPYLPAQNPACLYFYDSDGNTISSYSSTSSITCDIPSNAVKYTVTVSSSSTGSSCCPGHEKHSGWTAGCNFQIYEYSTEDEDTSVELETLASYTSAGSGTLPTVSKKFTLNPTYSSWRDECSECGNAPYLPAQNPACVYFLDASGDLVSSYATTTSQTYDVPKLAVTYKVTVSSSSTGSSCCPGHQKHSGWTAGCTYSIQGYKKPYITKNIPAGEIGIVLGENSLKITAVNTDTYQWMISSDKETWTNISDKTLGLNTWTGSQTASLTLDAGDLTYDNYFVKCHLEKSGVTKTVDSAIAQLKCDTSTFLPAITSDTSQCTFASPGTINVSCNIARATDVEWSFVKADGSTVSGGGIRHLW